MPSQPPIKTLVENFSENKRIFPWKQKRKAMPLPDVSRFNWKDGFYNPEKLEEYKAANERALAKKTGQPQSQKGGSPSKAGSQKKNFRPKKRR